MHSQLLRRPPMSKVTGEMSGFAARTYKYKKIPRRIIESTKQTSFLRGQPMGLCEEPRRLQRIEIAMRYDRVCIRQNLFLHSTQWHFLVQKYIRWYSLSES